MSGSWPGAMRAGFVLSCLVGLVASQISMGSLTLLTSPTSTCDANTDIGTCAFSCSQAYSFSYLGTLILTPIPPSNCSTSGVQQCTTQLQFSSAVVGANPPVCATDLNSNSVCLVSITGTQLVMSFTPQTGQQCFSVYNVVVNQGSIFGVTPTMPNSIGSLVLLSVSSPSQPCVSTSCEYLCALAYSIGPGTSQTSVTLTPAAATVYSCTCNIPLTFSQLMADWPLAISYLPNNGYNDPICLSSVSGNQLTVTVGQGAFYGPGKGICTGQYGIFVSQGSIFGVAPSNSAPQLGAGVLNLLSVAPAQCSAGGCASLCTTAYSWTLTTNQTLATLTATPTLPPSSGCESQCSVFTFVSPGGVLTLGTSTTDSTGGTVIISNITGNQLTVMVVASSGAICKTVYGVGVILGSLLGVTPANSYRPAPASSSSSNAGAIVGGVVGGLVGCTILGAVIFVVLKRKKAAQVDLAMASYSYALFDEKQHGGIAPTSHAVQ